MTREKHETAVERSLALHRAVVERIREDPSLVDAARRRVSRWMAEGSVALEYATAWKAILDRPLDEIVAALLAEGERAHDLRQVSPFAGALDPRERWRILRRLRDSVTP